MRRTQPQAHHLELFKKTAASHQAWQPANKAKHSFSLFKIIAPQTRYIHVLLSQLISVMWLGACLDLISNEIIGAACNAILALQADLSNAPMYTGSHLVGFYLVLSHHGLPFRSNAQVLYPADV